MVIGSTQIFREDLDSSKEGEVAELENVQRGTISLCGAKCLWWHVDKGSWYALGHGLGQLTWTNGGYSGVTQVSNLCSHACIQEDIAGSQIPVDYSWTAVVHEHQTPGDVLEDGQLCGVRDVGCGLQKLVQTSLQSLHHQHGELGVG